MLYEDDTLQLAADDDAPSLAPSVFDAVADLIYKAGGFDINQVKDPAARKLLIETAAAINRGVNTHLPTDVPDTLRYALEENSFIFSGFKTFHAMREIGLSLLNDKGEIKQYADFQADVLKLNDKYNKAYLYAEYKHAVSTSQMAAKWVGIETDGDRYLLQYRTAEDNRVREDHTALDGITLPPSDPFWSKYYPPNGWGCRCTAVQVRRGKYTESDPKAAMELGDSATEAAKQQIFRFNAGKEMKLFPDKHPYFKAPKDVKKAIDGYIPAEWTPKTVKQAEQFFRDNLGVNCALDGFTAKHMEQIKDIFRSVEEHFQRFPKLKKETLFVGSIRGRIKLLTEAKLAEYKKNYPDRDEETLKRWASSWAKKVGTCRNCYAYSHGFAKEYGLSGICFNTTWAGEKIETSLKRDCETKWHPPGCGTVKAVFDHELGHEIDRLIGLRTDGDFLKLFNEEKKKGKDAIGENLSRYGTKNEAEFIAEAWSEYLNNEKPRPIAVAVGTIIKKLYAKQNQPAGSSDK